LLGYAHSDHYELTALAGFLSDEEKSLVGNQDALAVRLVDLAKERFGRPLPKGSTARSDFLLAGMAVPEEGLAAMDRCASNMLAICGLGSMLKCTAPDVKLIDVPVFVGYGERDITGNARATGDALASCPDISLFELAGSGHNHNVAPNRTELWDRLAVWASTVVRERP
jgi:pimeloyl-ACP methyl ester carboxylesterase